MPADPLSRRASVDAVVLGLAAILGTGAFIVFAPAAALAGGWLPLAILVAGAVAVVSALAEADLSEAHPGAGAGYRWGRERLTPLLGRLAGLALLLGRTAAAAAAGLVFGDYVLPAYPVCVALPVIVVVGGLNAAGLRWTVRGAWFLVPGVLAVLAVVVVVGLTRHVPADWSVTGMAENAMGGTATPGGLTSDGVPVPADDAAGASYPVGPLGVLGAAGLVFFAFAGFSAAMPANRPRARRVGRSRRSSTPPAWLPGWWPSWLTGGSADSPAAPAAAAGAAVAPKRRQALGILLLISLLVYLLLAAALLHALGIARLALETAPLAAAVGGIDAAGVGALVRVCAAAATACALFGLLAGVGRTTVAMAANRDLPRWLGSVGARGRPLFTDLAAVVLAALIAFLLGPVASVALSACAVLVYYAVVNLAALRLPGTGRRWPAWRAGFGVVLCLGLAVLLPRTEVLITAAVLVVGCLASTFISRQAAEPEPPAVDRRTEAAAPEVPAERHADGNVGGLGGGVPGKLAGGVAGGVVFGGLALAGGDGAAGPAGGDGGAGADGGVAGQASDGGDGG